jgi:hypothetical protein
LGLSEGTFFEPLNIWIVTDKLWFYVLEILAKIVGGAENNLSEDRLLSLHILLVERLQAQDPVCEATAMLQCWQLL